MNITAIVLAAATFATMGASAQAADLSDMDYLRAARCNALASAKLVDVDASALDEMLRDQRYGRSSNVLQRVQSERSRANRQARSSDETVRAQLIAELNGPCQAWMGAAETLKAAKDGGPTAD